MTNALSFAQVELPDLLPPFDVDVDPATGGASYTFPLPLPVGRLGMGPALALAYRRGSAHSPYGFGWTLQGLASVTVYDQRRHPRYDGTDRYAFAGGELVPAVQTGAAGGLSAMEWDAPGHHVRRFRSRQESTFHRIEQWTNDGDVHWRVRRPDASIAVFGRRGDGSSRVRDPRHDERIYEWLLEAQYDRFGNAVRYDYVAEDARGVDRGHPAESGRSGGFAQRLLKRVRWGNDVPLGPDADDSAVTWAFEVVVDYGDHSGDDNPGVLPDRDWPMRADSYSSYRTGFDLRTHRLARRILLFHRFPELGGQPLLIRSVQLTHQESATASLLTGLTVHCYRHDDSTSRRSLPALTFRYSEPEVEPVLRTIDTRSAENLPQGLHGTDYRFVDLRGEGLNGVLTVTDGAWLYKRNLGGGTFGPQEPLAEMPATSATGALLSDFDRDGNFDLTILDGRGAGYSEYDRDTGAWSAFTPFAQCPVIAGPGRQDWVDVDGDGRPDSVLVRAERSLQFPLLGKAGYGAPTELPVPGPMAAPMLAERAEVGVFLADMSGDGALDVVHVQDGRVEYWPGLGDGALGDPVVMSDPPALADEMPLDVRRLRFADLDGTGTTDLIYVGSGSVRWWHNAAGNGFVAGGEITGLPQADDLCQAQVLDLLGDGTQCLAWSSALSGDARSPLRYLRLMAQGPPRLLVSVDSEAGAQTVLEYASSARHYLRDELSSEPWVTRLPSHVTVVDRKITIDRVASTRSVTRFEYHSGYFDSGERLFRGFLCVDVHDSGSFHRPGWGSPEVTATGPPGPDELPPEELGAASCRRRWHAAGDRMVQARVAARYWADDPQAGTVDSGPEIATDDPDAYRGLAGRLIREEVFAVDADGRRHDTPIAVESAGYLVRALQPALGELPAVYTVAPAEELRASYEQEAGDPRVEQRLVLASDPRGCETLVLDLGCPRRNAAAADHSAQLTPVAIVTRTRVDHVDDEDAYQLAVPIAEEMFDGRGLGEQGPLDRATALAAVTGALAAPLDHGAEFTGGAQLRRTSWERTYYRDAGRGTALPLGQTGPERLVHHERHACFPDSEVTRVYGDRVTAAILADDCGYLHEEGHWWARGPVATLLPADQFSLPAGSTEFGGATVSWQFDDHLLLRVSYTDEIGSTTSAELDYQSLAPWRITDANGAVAEARYDPYGVSVLTSMRGTVLDDAGTARPWGARPLSEHAGAPPAAAETVLADPPAAVGRASQARFCEPRADLAARRPPCMIEVTRESLADDGAGGAGPDEAVQVVVRHHDGLGRVVQQKTLVDPGPAVTRDPGGAIVTDAAGHVVQAPVDIRWRASGHIVFDSKQQAVLEHEPFHTASPGYEPDPLLQSNGVAVRSVFDAAGRLIGTVLPNGTRAGTTIRAWSSVTADPNDTVIGSDYELHRQGLPADDPQRQALEKARAHAGTPTTSCCDPLGREVLQIEAGLGGVDRRVARELDEDGNAVALVDARGITIARHDLDMAGRLIRRRSCDAGDLLVLFDILDQDVRHWDGRGFATSTTYDAAGRPLTVRVTGNGLDHVVERLTYGDDPAVEHAVARNARGLLVVQYDAAGRHESARFTPDGHPLEVRHRLRRAVDGEPDWSAQDDDTLEDTVFTARSSYDALGRPVMRTSPDGTTRAIRYRRSGGIARLAVSTADGALSDRDIVTASADNARGQLEALGLGNGAATTYGYDPETSRLASATTVVPAPGGVRTVCDVAVVRDPVGNITWLTDHAQEPAEPAPVLQGLSVSPVRNYTYDPHYQLVEATGRVHQALLPQDATTPVAGLIHGARHVSLANGAAIERYRQTYRYDLAGNLAQVRHAGTTRSWTQDMWISATSNRRLPALDAAGNPVTGPETFFDAAGNTARLPHLAEITWDHRNRLRSATVVDRGGAQPDDAEKYVYDAGGRRVRKVTERLTAGGLERTEKIFLEGCEFLRTTRDGMTRLQRTVALIEDDDRCYAAVYRWTADAAADETADVTRAEVRFLVPDHLGSTVLELDEQGTILTYEEHLPYGGSSFLAGDDLRRTRMRDRRYSGKERDELTGLYYYGYRYYAPWIGGWLNPDPIGTAASPNLYEFVAGNPVNLVDPDGLEPAGELTRLGTVKAGLSAEQAMRVFNNGQGRELGIRALELRRQGNDWIILRQENYTPRLQQLIDERGGDVQAAGTIYDIEEMFKGLTTPPADSEGGGDNGKETGAGPTGAGSGSGLKGTGTGGGGAADTPPAKPAADASATATTPGAGKGEGTGPGTGAGDQAQQQAAKDGGDDKGVPDGKPTGADTGSPTGARDGKPTGSDTGAPGGVAGGRTGGQPGGNPQGAASGGLDGRQDGDPRGSAGAAGATPVQGGLTGAAEGNPGDATGGSGKGAGDPTRRPGSTGTPGSGGGSGPPGGNQQPTTLDKITKIAGYWHLEFSGGEGGVSGGIPGGMGFLSGWGAQVAFLALTVADIVLTILTLGELKAALVGLKNAVKAGLRGLRSALGRGLRGMGRALLGLFRQGGAGQRTPLLRRLGRFFWEDRRSFGMWRDFRARWGIGNGSGWSMEHMIIKQRWYRGANPVFARGTRMNRLLQGLGDAGWNVVPIPMRLNGWFFRNPVVSGLFNYGTYAGGGYGLYRLWDYALAPLRGPAPAPQPNERAASPAAP